MYALTANTTVDEDFYISKGFNGYLTKPIDSRALETIILDNLPEHIVKRPSQEDAVEDLKEIPDELLWIHETEGLSTADGIKNSGGVSNYIFSLNLFLDTIDENAKIIRDAYKNHDIRLYTIKVHALKSSARIIGAMELSELAAAIENAGNKEDLEFIEENNDRLLADYEAYKDKLSRLHHEPDNKEKELISEKKLQEAYEALSMVVPQMDYNSVEMILNGLHEYALPPEDDAKIKELSGMLKAFDWDGMQALVAKGGQSDD